MFDLTGNYVYKLVFGDNEVAFTPESIREFTIVQDIESFLPSFKITLTDPTGLLAHILPFDRSMSDVYVEIKRVLESKFNSFYFKAYRNFVEAHSSIATNYTITGFLNIENLFKPNVSRGFSSTIRDLLLKLAFEEFKVDNVDISLSADVSRNVIQPNWSNAELLNYLRDNFSSSENTFYSYFKVKSGRNYLCFNSIQDLVAREVKYKFIIGDNEYQDYFPVFDYTVINNYMLYGSFGTKKQDYSYFDYDLGQQVDKSVSFEEFPSLTQYFLFDIDDSFVDRKMINVGRSNEFTKDFTGKATSNLYNRISGLVKMWILTWGQENVCPGDVVLVQFAHAISVSSMFTYQYSGYWLVERVVHSIGNTFKTRLLLTRNGVDSDQKASLVESQKRKRG